MFADLREWCCPFMPSAQALGPQVTGGSVPYHFQVMIPRASVRGFVGVPTYVMHVVPHMGSGGACRERCRGSALPSQALLVSSRCETACKSEPWASLAFSNGLDHISAQKGFCD